MRQARAGVKTGVIATAALLLGFVAACGTTTTSSSTATASSTAAVTSASPTASASAVASATPDATAGWVSYTSSANHLTLRHPADLNPLECGWVWVDATTATSCPQGDGLCCVFFRSSDNGQTGAFSLISTHTALYTGGITRTSVTVDGVIGTRLSGTRRSVKEGDPKSNMTSRPGAERTTSSPMSAANRIRWCRQPPVPVCLTKSFRP